MHSKSNSVFPELRLAAELAFFKLLFSGNVNTRVSVSAVVKA